MGWFSNIGSTFSNISGAIKTETKPETLAEQRKKHGFADFDATMQRLKDFDPEAQMQAQAPAPSTPTKPSSRNSKKGSQS